MNPVGHWRELESAGLVPPVQLPPLLLLSGPRGVGKGSVAQWLAEQAGASKFDLLNAGQLTVPNAEAIVEFSRSRPLRKVKVAITELGVNNVAWDRLLKLAEEPPSQFRLIVIASHAGPATLRSRAHIVRLHALTDDDLFAVLTEFLQWSPERASAVLPWARGTTVGAALAESLLEQLGPVEVYLQAVATGDVELCEAAIRGFRESSGSQALQLVRGWCGEMLSPVSRGRLFKLEQLSPEVRRLAADRIKVMKLFWALSRPGRPRVVARAAMMEVSRG